MRLYTFLSQIFDYGNTAVEKRALFYRRLLPLLEFGRERAGIDLSRVVLTHHQLRNLGRAPMPLGSGESPKIAPITGTGSGTVQEKQKAYLGELISRLNELFGAETTEQDQLVYVNHVLMGKLSSRRRSSSRPRATPRSSSPTLPTSATRSPVRSSRPSTPTTT